MTRILTAAVLFAIVIPVLIFSDTVVFPIFLALAGIMCVWETSRCKGLHKKWYMWLPSALYVAITPFAARFCPDVRLWLVLTAAFLVYIFFSGVFYYGKVSVNDLSFIALFGLYIAVGVYSLQALRCGAPKAYLLVFIAPWVSDAMAMYSGKLFGKRKLCPAISPKKTVEGSIGGVVANMIVFAGYAFVLRQFFDVGANVFFFAILGALFSVVGQFGDLIASSIKRHYNVKDFGSFFPGHGGVLDRFDSTLATAIVMLMLDAAFGAAFLIR